MRLTMDSPSPVLCLSTALASPPQGSGGQGEDAEDVDGLLESHRGARSSPPETVNECGSEADPRFLQETGGLSSQ